MCDHQALGCLRPLLLLGMLGSCRRSLQAAQLRRLRPSVLLGRCLRAASLQVAVAFAALGGNSTWVAALGTGMHLSTCAPSGCLDAV